MKYLYNEALWKRSLQIYAQRQQRFICNFLSFVFLIILILKSQMDHLQNKPCVGNFLSTCLFIFTGWCRLQGSIAAVTGREATWTGHQSITGSTNGSLTLTCPGINETNVHV